MLLEKFEFIPPENYSGFEPKEGAVKVIRRDCFQYVDRQCSERMVAIDYI